jgi:hypothetical protein
MNRRRTPKEKGQWSSAAARHLLEMAGHPTTIDEAVYVVAGRYLEGLPSPPTDLDAAARRAGVSEILAEDLPVSGELRRDGKNFKIVYSTYLSEARRRFTIAHELAHAIFESTKVRGPRNGVELERLCDMLASELLMPRDLFLSVGSSEPSVSNLLELAQTFKTSLSATGIRYAKLKGVSIFYIDDGSVAWGSGIVRKGPVSSLDFGLRLALTHSENGKPMTSTVLLSQPKWTGEWKLDYHPLHDGKRAVCMLQPNYLRK